MDHPPPPPGFVRVSIACRACWREDVLHLQRGGIMTLDRLRCRWRRCAGCQSGDIEVAEASGPIPCRDVEQHGSLTPAARMRSIRGDKVG